MDETSVRKERKKTGKRVETDDGAVLEQRRGEAVRNEG